MKPRLAVTLFFCFVLHPSVGFPQRTTVSLDGQWEIEESVGPDEIPVHFGHTITVPGLLHLATPPFPDAGKFDSPEEIVKRKLLPATAIVPPQGISRQSRNYFWYRTAFRPLVKKQVAILKINKAVFGTAVWLNGKKIGDHLGCFTAGYFNISAAIDWNGNNQVLVRIGAHPAALPPTVPPGSDVNKNVWLPGIYDSVSLVLTDNPVVESVQVAPQLQSSEIIVQTRIRNYGARTTVPLIHRLDTGASASEKVTFESGEKKVLLHRIRIAEPVLWTPERPHLYELSTSTGGDSVETRFGMRELRFDTVTKRAYLNGKPYFLRGSNIALHRFFEDPKCDRLPWDEKWVRKLLGEIPKRLNWNSMRFHIGPVPEFWLNVADEAGILVFQEFPIWGYRAQWDTGEVTGELKEWMRDQWNHPSVGYWDACNETFSDKTGEIIQAVRSEDLSGRAWDNAYNHPQGPDDPVEEHNYQERKLILENRLGEGFEFVDLEKMTGGQTQHPTGHAAILNEYGWVFLQRNGEPTEGTVDLWPKLAPHASTAERVALQAYLVGGLTEYWRAYRNFAGVLNFIYLTYSLPNGVSSDRFADVKQLILEPNFEDYIREAFKPVGVYLNFWHPSLVASSKRRFAVMMVNDGYESVAGSLILSLAGENGIELTRSEVPFSLAALGQQTYNLDLGVPTVYGKCLLKAAAYVNGKKEPTVSRRRVALVEK